MPKKPHYNKDLVLVHVLLGIVETQNAGSIPPAFLSEICLLSSFKDVVKINHILSPFAWFNVGLAQMTHEAAPSAVAITIGCLA